MKTLCIFGTRPEAIKMAPIAKALNAHPSIQNKICITGQHTDMLSEVMRTFDMQADFDLATFRQGQATSELFSKIMKTLGPVLDQEQPDWVLVHGDTTSMIAAGLTAFYQKIKIAHIEAGLRTYDMLSPWPEEAHRRMASAVTSHHFCPTESSRKNLIQEQIPADRITVTGNSVIDALFMIRDRLNNEQELRQQIDHALPEIDKNKSLILVTGHRHENFNAGLGNMCDALLKLAEREDVQIIFPVHLNPKVQTTVREKIEGIDNIHLIGPVAYPSFIRLIMQAKLIITDSGGIQEEAPSLGIPVLVTRTQTERPEGIKAQTALLVGIQMEDIYREAKRLLDSPEHYSNIASKVNPYGDGKATEVIIDKLLELN